MTLIQLKALLTLIICDDPTELPKEERDAIMDFANDESKRHGYRDWVDALHEIPPQ